MGVRNFDLFLVFVSVDQMNLSKSPVSLCLSFYSDNRRGAVPILLSPLENWAGDVHSIWVCTQVSACVCVMMCVVGSSRRSGWYQNLCHYVITYMILFCYRMAYKNDAACSFLNVGWVSEPSLTLECSWLKVSKLN